MGYRHKKHVVQGIICVTTHYLLSDGKKTEGTGQTDQLHNLFIQTSIQYATLILGSNWESSRQTLALVLTYKKRLIFFKMFTYLSYISFRSQSFEYVRQNSIEKNSGGRRNNIFNTVNIILFRRNSKMCFHRKHAVDNNVV
jgi:hypothetical protein